MTYWFEQKNHNLKITLFVLHVCTHHGHKKKVVCGRMGLCQSCCSRRRKELREDLSCIEWKDTVEYKFPLQEGYVIKVYDGDTITIAYRLPYKGSPLYRSSVRLKGIDAPEMKGKGVGEEEKAASIVARDYLQNLVLRKWVRLENVEVEKYGRILADVYCYEKNVCVNNLMLEQRLAVAYDGGTKKKPDSWSYYRETGNLLVPNVKI